MTTCHDIQLWWELPSIAHFCSLFRAAFDLLDFDIEELEEAILTDGLDGSGSPLLVELLVRLVQGCMPGRTVTPANIDSCLRKLFRQKCQENSQSVNIFADGDFRGLTLRRKVEILHTLCDFRLDAEDVVELLKNLETESLRVEPLGFDDKGSTYWYFYGTRLYREDHSYYHPFRRKYRDDKRKHKRKRKSSDSEDDDQTRPVWQVACFTEDDWTSLADTFEACESRLERQLLMTLKEDFLPEIPRLFEEKEKRRLMEFAPRRTSGRVQKQKEKKEEEERRLAEFLVNHDHKTEALETLLDDSLVSQPITAPEISFEDELLADLEENVTDKRDKKRRKLDPVDDPRHERDEDVLQERNEDSPHKRKDKKAHHKKHRRKPHKNRDKNRDEVLSVSDMSNKENNCTMDTSFSEDTSDQPDTKPKVFIGRKTNNSLSSVAFSLTPSTVVPESTPQIVNSEPSKKKVKTAHMLLQTEDELRTGMYKVLEHLSTHEDAWPFKDRVEEGIAPNYYVVIRRPMYIIKMEERVDSGHYKSLSMFESDFKLMMDNCKLYNGPDSEYTHMAYTLEKLFAKLKSKYLETEFSSDEEICIELSFQQQQQQQQDPQQHLAAKHRKKKPHEEIDKKKRGRKKNKCGRKPKTNDHHHRELATETAGGAVVEKIDRRTKEHRNKVKLQPMEDVSEASEHDDIVNEPDLFDDYDGLEPVLMVRQDPYARQPIPEDLSTPKDTPDDDDPVSSPVPSEPKPDLTPDKPKNNNKKKPKILKAKKSNYLSNSLEDPKASDSEFDSDHDVALLYYNNDEDELTDEAAADPVPDKQSELFGDSDAPPQTTPTKHAKSESPKKRHKHHHRHHRTSKHHHHHHKRKHVKTPAKKVLSVDEVFGDSEDELPPTEWEEPVPEEELPEEPPSVEVVPEKPSRKARRKTKHDKHHKHQKHKETKQKVTKKKRNSNSKRKKKVQTKPDIDAIEALSVATEQTLKDISSLPKESNPKFLSESPPSPTSHVTSEFDPVAVKIETEYRQKLNSATEEKKTKKRKKRRSDDPPGTVSKKKVKREKKADLSNDTDTKELFKDLKDGRIKPGAIIKSKDIAKKEGQVKKETKTTDTKVKAQKNPFGKINKQENSKLTTLIAKAKESRIGLVPNSEVGDSPKLSLGSILLFGDIGSGKHSIHEPNSPEEEDKPVEKYDSPWDKESKDESSQFAVQSIEDEEESKEEVEEVSEESPENVIEDVVPPPTPKGTDPKQDKVTPNLSAWLRAFGAPKVASPSKQNGDDDEYDEHMHEHIQHLKQLDEQQQVKADIKIDSPVSTHDPPHTSPTVTRVSSPDIPISPGKPPETPWYNKLDEKPEEEPIWKKKKSDEDEDPYKFEEEELDRAREEAKKLEVERQRKASVSSSGLSDPSPLNIDSDRSPAFSSEGERSPAMRSPVTPGFGNAEKSPNVPAFSPRYDSGLAKGFSSYDADKSKYQANGSLKVGFYQDITDKSAQDKTENNKSLELKHKDSPIYSPTVPYVSPYYNKEQSKQKSPGRFSSYYSSIDATLDKPKTPGYYPPSAPSTPSDRPSPAANVPEDKQKTQFNYYNYDPTKPLTDQYKNTGSSIAKPFYETATDRSPAGQSTPGHAGLGSPLQQLPNKPSMVSEKPDLQPPKKRPLVHRAIETASQNRGLSKDWDNKPEVVNGERNHMTNRTEPYMPLPANLANLSQIVSRIPEPCTDTDKSHPDSQSSKTVHPQIPYNSTSLPDVRPSTVIRPSQTNHTPASELSLHQQLTQSQVNPHIMGKDIPSDHQTISHLQPPPAAHQKTLDSDRPGSRNVPPQAHSSDKPLSYMHQKTMWTSSLPSLTSSISLSSSLPSSLSSLVSSATMAQFGLGGQKGFGSLSSEHLAHMDRATLASLASRQPPTPSNLFPHDLLQRSSNQTQPPSNANPAMTMQSQSSNSTSHSRSSVPATGSAAVAVPQGPPSNNFDLGLARSYANMMTAVSQSSPLFGRTDNVLSRSLSGTSSPFLSQSPGLGATLGMPGSSRTPTPAHQPALGQHNFPARDPRDPISHTHPSLQIPNMNTISNGQTQGLSHLNAANLGYPNLMNQSGRGALVPPPGSLDPAHQQFYTQYFQRQQQLAQEELLLRSTAMGSSQLAAHQSMMIQQGLMSAAAAGYPSGYPHSLGLRSGTYQGMTRPWI